MRDFYNLVREKCYVGAEKLFHIPCSIGGAIAMNAGSHGQSISDTVLSVDIMDAGGRVYTAGKDELNFGYRTASIPRNHVVIGATFRFDDREPDDEYFQRNSDELVEFRKTRQPKGPNFGSVFKNCADSSAGELIDRAGLKGRTIGGAVISEVHANFIVNRGQASSKDIEKLIDLMRYEVYSKLKKLLQTEVKFLRV
jgi:UDP-N-acetylmuramate dehydrogenase